MVETIDINLKLYETQSFLVTKTTSTYSDKSTTSWYFILNILPCSISRNILTRFHFSIHTILKVKKKLAGTSWVSTNYPIHNIVSGIKELIVKAHHSFIHVIHTKTTITACKFIKGIGCGCVFAGPPRKWMFHWALKKRETSKFFRNISLRTTPAICLPF